MTKKLYEKNAMEYESLYSRNRQQNPRKIFAHFPYKGKEGETWEAPFECLAHLAKKEDWNFQRADFKSQYAPQEFPILENYLNYTFLRLQEEHKIVYSEDDSKACFNTGL